VARVLRRKLALQALAGRLDKPALALVSSCRVRFEQVGARLDKPALAVLTGGSARLGQAGARLDALSPLASLGRGYSICLKPDGSIVSRKSQVRDGDEVGLRVSDGTIGCRVERTGDN
jgi:exodeoxyribonuclease VII large subunit